MIKRNKVPRFNRFAFQVMINTMPNVVAPYLFRFDDPGGPIKIPPYTVRPAQVPVSVLAKRRLKAQHNVPRHCDYLVHVTHIPTRRGVITFSSPLEAQVAITPKGKVFKALVTDPRYVDELRSTLPR